MTSAPFSSSNVTIGNQVYAQYKVAPAVTRTRMYYEMMERVLRANPVVVGGSPAAYPPPTNGLTPSSKPEGQ